MRDENAKTATAKAGAADGYREMLELAMQVSATIEGTPQTCRRQVCRRLERCHMRLEKNGVIQIDCGGLLDIGLVDRAEIMLAFAARLAEKSGLTEEKIREIEKRLEAGSRTVS